MIETASPLHILLVDDHENERLLFRRAFQQSDISCEITGCANAEQAMERLDFDASSFDIVVVDGSLPGISGMDLCRKLLDEKVPLPLVFSTETGSEQLAAEAIRSGVHDYIIKDPKGGYLELLPMLLINVARRYEEYHYYKQTNETIQGNNRAAHAFLESIPDMAGMIDIDENVLMINKAGAESLGKRVDEIIGRNAHEIISGKVYELRRSRWTQAIQTGKTSYLEDERDGKYFETWFYPVFNANGKVESIAVFAHDITERKKTEKALRQSEEKFRLAMEVTNDALWDWNITTNEVYRNPRHATMLGYEPHELTASQDEWEKRIHPDDRQAMFQSLDEHLAGKRDSLEIEYRLKTKAGDYKWLLGRGKVVAYNDDGSPARMIGTNIDITDRKNMLKRDEIMLKTCIDGFWLIDTHGQILEVNDAYCRMSGYSRDELLTMKIKDVEAAEKPEEILQHIREIKNKGSHRFESRQRRKDGTIMDLDISATYLELDGGRMFTFFRDITATKQAEKEIRKFKTIADKAGHGIAMADLHGNLVYVNDSYAQMHQYNSCELIGKNLSILHTEEQMESVNKLNDQLKQKGIYVAEEVWHKKRDNTIFPTLMSATLVRDESEEPLFMATTAIDITKHKKAEELLRYSEERYRSVVEDSPVLLCSFLPDGEIVFVNNAYCKYFGKTSKELIGSNFKHLIPEEDRQAVLDNIMSLTVGSPTMTHEHKVYAPDGRIRWQRWTNRALFDGHGRAVSFQAFGEDITKQRNTEKALADSEEKYRTLIECAGDPIFTIDEKGVLLFANKRAEEDFSASLVGKTLWDLFPKEIADRKAANVRKVIKTGRGLNMLSLTEIKGKPCWYNVTIEPLRDDRGSVNAAMVIVRNIDDIKRAEEQIQMLSSAVESSIDGIAIGDVEGNLTFVNNSFLKMWGYKNLSEVLGRKAEQFWKANNKAAEIEDALKSGEGWIGELTAVRKDGSSFDVQVSQTSVRDEDGAIVSLMASFVDITGSKRREEELTKYREQMARAEQLASLGMLSATIAHQLTQPLTVIRLSIDNALDELESSPSSPTVIRRLKDSVTQVSNITSIIERFRNFARKSSGRTVSEVNLKAVAVRIAGLLSESARSSSIILRIRNMDDLPCPWVNENDLEQLFFALIGNAIQAADGKKTRQLVISAAVKDKYIELRLADDCGGIAPENIDKIFDPFFTTKPRGQGTGLGLCIVQDIVSRTGGHVRVENKFGKGATFIIHIPIDKDKIS